MCEKGVHLAGIGAASQGRATRTRLAALAVLPGHNANVHVAQRLRLRLERLLERIPQVGGAKVRILEVGHADILPRGHGGRLLMGDGARSELGEDVARHMMMTMNHGTLS